MTHRGRNHLATQRGASESTIKNRRKKLYSRLNSLIDNATLPTSEKVFLKQGIKGVIHELLDIEFYKNEPRNERKSIDIPDRQH